jgi:uncharacterized protein (TIGR00255 family)
MTAFARRELQADWGNAVWEIRSVNHRYLEIGFRLPDIFSHIEPVLREQLKSRLQRGKVDISLRYQPAASAGNQININKELAQQLIQARGEIASLVMQVPPLNPTDILRWPGVLQIKDLDSANLRQSVLDLFNQTLDELIEMRKREGIALAAILEARLKAMEQEIINAKKILPQISLIQREKIVARLTEAKVNFDPARLEQELIFYAQKMDVTEEIDRLTTHIHEARKTLAQGNAVGRRLDFLMQELNREANTLGAKSVATETTQTSVELKILIDQMREQVQNIE